MITEKKKRCSCKGKCKRCRKKTTIGLGWGNPDHYGAIPYSAPADSGGMSESLLIQYIKEVLEK